MAIFKKDEPQLQKSQKPRERPVPATRTVSGDAAISIIGEGMVVVGDIETEGIIRIEGRVRGTVKAGKAVILGQVGVVDGDILTSDAVVGGMVNGSISARNRLELQSSSVVNGEIRTPAEHLKLDEGARFAGRVVMEDSGAPVPETKQLPAPAQPNPRTTSSAAPAQAQSVKPQPSTNGAAANGGKGTSSRSGAAEVSADATKSVEAKAEASSNEESPSSEEAAAAEAAKS